MSAHVPVLVAETLQYLLPEVAPEQERTEWGGLFVDCTVGLGGHSRALLEAGAGRLIGFDRDASALAMARETLAAFGDRVELVHADYRELAARLDERGVAAVDGLIADLGVSSYQLDDADRGFSFRHDAPLDMRMDTSRGPTVAELLRDVEETDLANVIYTYGEERYSRRIARAIVRAREASPITTTGQLAAIVRRSSPQRGYHRIDPSTRTFQALRIWVNRELEGLDTFVRDAAARLRIGARLVVISFHSLEDRVVKHTLRDLGPRDATGPLRVLTKRPVEAGEAELARNARARSAKLRAAERIA